MIDDSQGALIPLGCRLTQQAHDFFNSRCAITDAIAAVTGHAYQWAALCVFVRVAAVDADADKARHRQHLWQFLFEAIAEGDPQLIGACRNGCAAVNLGANPHNIFERVGQPPLTVAIDQEQLAGRGDTGGCLTGDQELHTFLRAIKNRPKAAGVERPIGALSFVLHPQAFDRPANLFRNYQTLYQVM